MAPAPKLEGKASAIISPAGDIQFRLNLGSSWLATVSQHLDKRLDPSLPDFRVSLWIHAEGTSTQLLMEPPIWADRSHGSTCRTAEILLTKICEDREIKMKWDLEEEATAVEDEDEDEDRDNKDEDEDGNDGDDDQSSDDDDSDEEFPPAKMQKTSNEDMPIEILSSDEERDQEQKASDIDIDIDADHRDGAITAEKGKGKDGLDKGYLKAGEIVCSLPTDPADYGTSKVIPHPTKEGIYLFARNADGKIESLPDSPQLSQASVSETRLKQTLHPPSKQPSTISSAGVSETELNQPSHPPSRQPSTVSSPGSSNPKGQGKAPVAKAACPDAKVSDNQAGAALNDSPDPSPIVSSGQRTIKPTTPAPSRAEMRPGSGIKGSTASVPEQSGGSKSGPDSSITSPASLLPASTGQRSTLAIGACTPSLAITPAPRSTVSSAPEPAGTIAASLESPSVTSATPTRAVSVTFPSTSLQEASTSGLPSLDRDPLQGRSLDFKPLSRRRWRKKELLCTLLRLALDRGYWLESLGDPFGSKKADLLRCTCGGLTQTNHCKYQVLLEYGRAWEVTERITVRGQKEESHRELSIGRKMRYEAKLEKMWGKGMATLNELVESVYGPRHTSSITTSTAGPSVPASSSTTIPPRASSGSASHDHQPGPSLAKVSAPMPLLAPLAVSAKPSITSLEPHDLAKTSLGTVVLSPRSLLAIPSSTARSASHAPLPSSSIMPATASAPTSVNPTAKTASSTLPSPSESSVPTPVASSSPYLDQSGPGI